jgi:hypothetical protein
MTPFTVPARSPAPSTEPAAAGTPSRGAATPEGAVRAVLDAWREGNPAHAEQYLGDDPEFGRARILPLPAGHKVLLVTGSCDSQGQPDRVRCMIAQPDDAAVSGEALVVGTPSSGYLVTQIYLIDYD